MGLYSLLSYIDMLLLGALFFAWLGWLVDIMPWRLRVGVGVLAVILLLPVGNLSLYMYPRALFGDLSLTTKLFLGAWILYRLGGPKIVSNVEFDLVFRSVAIFGLFFYPLSLGLTPFDPYAAGYTPGLAIVWVVIAVIFCLKTGKPFIAAGLSAGTLGYLLSLQESENLFDYLIDAPLFLYALGYCCVKFARSIIVNTSPSQP